MKLRRTLALPLSTALAATLTLGTVATPQIVHAPVATAAVTAAEGLNQPFRDAAGTSSTYHLYLDQAKATAGSVKGVAVYLDGDGMYGVTNPNSPWALAGTKGLVAQAASHGYALAAVHTPDRSGTPTFWEDGKKNAAYVAALIRKLHNELGVTSVWLVGYSGGAQLITQHLLPDHAAQFTTGGAVIMGGGGEPEASTSLTATAQQRASFPLLWRTGSLDDGTTADDGYNALADARRGHSWYASRGFTTAKEEPAGVDHDDLGTTFGTVLARQLATYPTR